MSLRRAALDGKGLDAVFPTKRQPRKSLEREPVTPLRRPTGKAGARQAGMPRGRLTGTPGEQEPGQPLSRKGGVPLSQEVKETFYLSREASARLDDLRSLLRHRYGLRPSETSKSAIVDLLLRQADGEVVARTLTEEKRP